ncbi:hypothetical protein BC938DRAFT_479238 [Jimgerdemannia flammicorona]|uniref:Uncharacterized protein n=1 Tax=Jimgerdemannia flammicorona TaxID=994334 RepID=A0A433QLB7_9FUNG|nr:hypothetical protein BC938DRAFT_479238 [Jimgerdemannia flammicorona]
MAVLTLQTLAAQCEWILSKYALSCVGIDPISGTSLFLLAAASFIRFRAILEVKLVSVVCHLLLSNSPQIRTAASECACVLFSRNFPHLEDRSTVIWPVLDEGGLDIIFAAYSNVQLTPGQDVVDDTEFVKWLVQVRSCRNDSVPCCSFTDDMGMYIWLFRNKYLVDCPDA